MTKKPSTMLISNKEKLIALHAWADKVVVKVKVVKAVALVANVLIDRTQEYNNYYIFKVELRRFHRY